MNKTGESCVVCLMSFVSFEIVLTHGEGSVADEVLQIKTYARHSLPLSSGGSLACQTYFDKRHCL